MLVNLRILEKEEGDEMTERVLGGFAWQRSRPGHQEEGPASFWDLKYVNGAANPAPGTNGVPLLWWNATRYIESGGEVLLVQWLTRSPGMGKEDFGSTNKRCSRQSTT
jgi:hypothetical protein